jgi:DNA-binding MarR family transcriptional regulator
MEAFDLMWRIGAAYRRRAAAALRPFGITFAQYELIAIARRRGALSPSVAAKELGWDRPTLTVVARSCGDAGWLKRSRAGLDRRAARLQLTGAGEEILDRIEAAKPFAVETLGDPLDVISAEERGNLARLLDRVSRRAGDVWGR